MSNEGFFQRVPLTARRETEKIREDTGTEVNYAELTWSNRQILCDSLQNNLDAETRKFVAELERRHIPDATTYIQQVNNSPEWRGLYLNVLHLLHTLSVRASDLDFTEKDRLVRKINQAAHELGITLQGVDAEHFKTSERPKLPTVTYAIKDAETGKVIRNLTQDDLSQGGYSDPEKFPLFEWKVEDGGSGYDATKSVLYLPTKKGEQFSRGMFGEGLKVNQAAIARTPGVNLRIHSQFEKEDGSTTAWVRHVYPEDNIVMQKGREVDQRVGDGTGSGTTIRFVDLLEGNKELRETLDPRVTEIGEVAAEFGKHNFRYPLGVTEDDFVQPGITLDGSPSAQYLQGLRIGTSSSSLLFSYDFQNRDVIAGRDRNHLQPSVMRETVKGFWKSVKDASLHREFLQRVVLSDSNSYAPEREAFFDACKRLHDGVSTDGDEVLFQELIATLHLRSDIPNYIATRGDGRVEHIDESKAHVVQLKISCNKNESTLLRELLRSRCRDYFFVTPREVVPEASPTAQTTELLESEFTEKEKKFSKDLNQMFLDLSKELVPFDEAFRSYSPIAPTIQYVRAQYLSSTRFGVSTKANKRDIICYIPSDGKDDTSVPELSDPSVYQEFEAKLLEVYLAAKRLGSGRFSSDHPAYGEHAQMSAQELLDTLSCPLETDTDVSDRLEPLYRKALVLQQEQLRGREQKKTVESLVIKLHSYQREAFELECAPEQILEIMKWCREHADLYGTRSLRYELSKRVIVANGVATYVAITDGGEEVRHFQLVAENQTGVWNGYPEFKLDDDRFVIPVETHHNTVFKMSDKRMIAICNGLSVYIDMDDYEVQSGEEVASNRIYMDKGCIISTSPLSTRGGGYSFHAIPQERALNDTTVETGIVKSPVTLEYISDHWSDPVRIFQDLGQNHMDAGGFEERFLILEDGEKRWISGDQLGYSAEILGYELSDRGLGYSPSGIHTMGHTRKRNPFLTGKNGEGLKLAAASAKKQGFNISFASFGRNQEGAEVSWQAVAKTLPEEYTHDGKTNTAQRLVFDITENNREALEDKSAVTQLVLPDNADADCIERWSLWMDRIDPRHKDQWGTGGLNRYLLTTEGAKGKADTVGPTTVLLERPGEIFENGTLIRAEEQAERRYTLGWNFPSITSTRERTHIDEDMAQAYIQHFFENTTDEAAIEHLLKSIQTHDIGEYAVLYADKDGFSRILDIANQRQRTLDVDPDWALPDSEMYPSLSLFQQKAKELYPGKILFSYETAKLRNISMGGSMRHIRPEERLNVSAKDYEVLRHIFPTMQDFMNDVNNSIIDIDSDTLEPLRSVVGEEIKRVEVALDRLEQNPTTASILDFILKTSNTTRKQVTSSYPSSRTD
jgi:hypothetical protein